jgi:hypothetical protein
MKKVARWSFMFLGALKYITKVVKATKSQKYSFKKNVGNLFKITLKKLELPRVVSLSQLKYNAQEKD